MKPLEHIPVLLEEAVNALAPKPNRVYVDGTLGGGGHARKLCEQLDETNTLVGIDQDPVALEHAMKRFEGCTAQVKLMRGNFGDLGNLLFALDITKVDGGILLDLGISAFQIQDPERGFSFREAAPLDMRMNPNWPQSAADIINTYAAPQMADIFYQYADERLSRQIATAIVACRPIESTKQLANIVESVYNKKKVKDRHVHPATRVFQALRIAVNHELEMLEVFLEQATHLLQPGARLAIITFHSIEDRMVKNFLRLASATCVCPPRQPICTCNHQPTFKLKGKKLPSAEETERNPQARSATLRIAERLPEGPQQKLPNLD